MMRKSLICLAIWLSSMMVWAGHVEVRIERQPVLAGKPFTVTYRINNPTQAVIPDFTPLERKFSLLSTGSSTRVSIINGQRQSEIIWSVLLQTNQTGQVILPAVQFGNDASKPRAIDVVTASGNKQKQPSAPKEATESKVYLKATANSKKPYINEAVVYTVKLYRQRGVFVNGSYEPPDIDNALVVPLDKTQDSEIMPDGRAFLVESMHYVLYPNDKGKLSIHPPSLSGTLNDLYMRRFQIKANPVTLDVQSIPQNADDFWLPAQNVTLSQHFSQNVEDVNQGDTVVRTITLRAKGLPGQLIPELTLPKGTHAKVYEDKPTRDNSASRTEVTGSLSMKVTYLFDQPGESVLPEMTVRWFNTQSRQFESDSLEEIKVLVTPKAGYSPPPTPTKPSIKKPQKIVSPATEPLEKPIQTASLSWQIISQLLALVVLLGVIVWLGIKLACKPAKPEKTNALSRNQRMRLKKACRTNEAHAARDALIDWAGTYFKQNTLINLTQVNAQIGHLKLNQAITQLNHHLYAPNASDLWQGDPLWQAWQDYMQKKQRNPKDKSRLAPLFPDT